MNGVWIDEGSSPDYPKLRARGCRRLYFSSRSVEALVLHAVRMDGFEAGIYWASTWDPALPPEQQAQKLSDTWVALGVSAFVMVDLEAHDPDAVLAFFTAWRRLRPKIATAWTMEGFQGGWIVELRDALTPLNLRYVPQCYDGSMGAFDVAGVVKDLTDYGFPAARVEPFHDAAALHRGWYGCAFTQARLPS